MTQMIDYLQEYRLRSKLMITRGSQSHNDRYNNLATLRKGNYVISPSFSSFYCLCQLPVSNQRLSRYGPALLQMSAAQTNASFSSSLGFSIFLHQSPGKLVDAPSLFCFHLRCQWLAAKHYPYLLYFQLRFHWPAAKHYLLYFQLHCHWPAVKHYYLDWPPYMMNVGTSNENCQTICQPIREKRMVNSESWEGAQVCSP